MNLKSRVFCAVTAMSLLTSSGCSLFVPGTQNVSIRASDPKAEISIDGQVLGVGNVSKRLDRNVGHTVMARIGDRVGVSNIRTKISMVGVLDLVGGLIFLVPFIGIIGPGFWQLEPDSVIIAIPPAPAAR